MAESVQKRPELQAGRKVFLPGHGVALVLGREERDFGDDRQIFFAFELSSGSKLLLPSDRLESVGVRNLVSPGRAKDLVQQVADDPRKGPVRADMATRRKRAASHADALVDGSIDGYIEVLLELLRIAEAGKLSASEKRTLESVRRFFLDEVGASLGMRDDEIETACQI